jgi:hypothetical protein
MSPLFVASSALATISTFSRDTANLSIAFYESIGATFVARSPPERKGGLVTCVEAGLIRRRRPLAVARR